MYIPEKLLEKKILRFLEEDVGQGDITTLLTIPRGVVVQAEVVVREKGVVAGLEDISAFLEGLGFQADASVSDGSEIRKDTTIMTITGDARTLLSVERTLLNLLTRMSGIATQIRRVVAKVHDAGYKPKIACTRKVAPGLLHFDKKAVMLGGGDTHRLHLDDLVLIKDNHLAIIGNVGKAVQRARKAVPFSKKIEVEVSSKKDALQAVEAGADIIMLDNLPPPRIRSIIFALEKKGLRDHALVEASGGINEENVVEYAATGADILSLGEITDSTKALDMSLGVAKVIRTRTA